MHTGNATVHERQFKVAGKQLWIYTYDRFTFKISYAEDNWLVAREGDVLEDKFQREIVDETKRMLERYGMSVYEQALAFIKGAILSLVQEMTDPVHAPQLRDAASTLTSSQPDTLVSRDVYASVEDDPRYEETFETLGCRGSVYTRDGETFEIEFQGESVVVTLTKYSESVAVIRKDLYRQLAEKFGWCSGSGKNATKAAIGKAVFALSTKVKADAS